MPWKLSMLEFSYIQYGSYNTFANGFEVKVFSVKKLEPRIEFFFKKLKPRNDEALKFFFKRLI